MREMLAETVEKVLANICQPALVRSVEVGQWPAEFWQQLQETGLPLALAPESVGGVAVGWHDALPILLGCGRYAVPVPLAETVAAHGLATCAGVELPEGILTLADFGHDQGGAGTLTLTAQNVPFASVADWVVGSLEHREGGESFTELIVLRKADAAQNESARLGGEGRADLYWCEVTPVLRARLPAGMSARVVGAAIRSAQLAGAIGRVLELSVVYADERKQFGKTLSKFQALQQQLAVLGQYSVSAAMAAELAGDSADACLDPQRVGYAKALVSEVAHKAAMIAHALHGAIGTTAEYDLQLLTRRIWAWRLDFGSEAYWNLFGGQALIGSGEAVWSRVVELSNRAPG